MLSKMTFSLVLVFAFALTLIATSVDAQTYVDLGTGAGREDIKGKFVVLTRAAPGVTTHGFITGDAAADPVVDGPTIGTLPTTVVDLNRFLQEGGTIEVLVKVGW